MNYFRIEIIFILTIVLGCESELEIDSSLNDNQLTNEVAENEISMSDLKYGILKKYNSNIDLEKVCSDTIIKIDIDTDVF